MNGLRILVGLAILVAVVQANALRNDEESNEWESFKRKYGKQYESEAVEAVRKAIYFDHKKRVAAHNVRYQRGEVSYTVALNHLADLTTHEFAQQYNGYKRSPLRSSFNRTIFTATGAQVPDTVDWREQNIVTPVKNQGQCGGCWAFSSTGSMEGQHALKTGKLVSLSEQNLIDCSSAYGNKGCNGGLMDYAFNYVVANKGVDTEASYPFTGNTESCEFNAANVGATISSHVDVASGDENALKEAVGTVGPISVAIDASSWAFQFYFGGIYDGGFFGRCSSTDLDHGVLAVGYGTDSGKDYWLVKNSWGTFWGEDGYIRMARNKNNLCGIATDASYPIV